MADYERRSNGPPRGGGGRKRRYRGLLSLSPCLGLSRHICVWGILVANEWFVWLDDDDDYDRRPQRRRYEEPLVGRIRRLLFTIAESVCLILSRLVVF